MSLLSNLPFLRHLRPPTAAGVPIGVRPARPDELAAAIRLIIRPPHNEAGDAQVEEFVQIAQTTSDKAGGLWLAERQGKPVSAVLPMVSPGRTMLLFCPQPTKDPLFTDLTRMALEAACHRAAECGIVLAQALVDPHDSAVQAIYAGCGFTRLAELLYMQSRVARRCPEPSLTPGHHWVPYSQASHDLFGQTILAAYADSLDCPGLNGLRDIDDILAGHKATGEFDPRLWLLLMNQDTPLGVMLLSPVPRNDAVEVVYLAITPQARGRGLADILMRQAEALTAASPMSHLTLAVDAANTPALKLYWRHGMQSLARKVAFLRVLR